MKRVLVLVAAAALVGGLLAGCSSGGKANDAQATGQRLTEQAFAQQAAAVKYPAEQLRDSQERRNLREKLLRFNDPNKIGYVYLFSQTGSVIGFWTVKGKVSSTQSQMTTPLLVKDYCGKGCRDLVAVTAPGDDGSYGENERAIFFFTTEGVYVSLAEASNWVYLDAPLELKSAPVVVLNQSEKPSSAVEIGKR